MKSLADYSSALQLEILAPTLWASLARWRASLQDLHTEKITPSPTP